LSGEGFVDKSKKEERRGREKRHELGTLILWNTSKGRKTTKQPERREKGKKKE